MTRKAIIEWKPKRISFHGRYPISILDRSWAQVYYSMAQLVFFLESGHGVRKRPLIISGGIPLIISKYEIGGRPEFKEEEASPWTQNPCAYTTQSEPPRGLPEERLNGKRLFFDPSDSHPLTGLVPWTSATNAENCDWNYDACLSCWPIATPIHLSKHSRWSFFVALSHEEGVERDFKSPNDFRWMCEPWYGDGDLLGASKPRAPTHPKSGGLFPVPRGLH